MDLGDIEPTWRGVFLNHGRIWLPEGLSYSRSELGAEWWNRQLIRELRRRAEHPIQWDFFKDCWMTNLCSK
jgi:hypothetical protein